MLSYVASSYGALPCPDALPAEERDREAGPPEAFLQPAIHRGVPAGSPAALDSNVGHCQWSELIAGQAQPQPRGKGGLVGGVVIFEVKGQLGVAITHPKRVDAASCAELLPLEAHACLEG